MKKTMIVLLALLMAVSVFAGCEVRNPMYDGSSAASATAEPSSEPEPTEMPSEAPSEVESSSGTNTSDLLTALTGDSDEEKIAAYVRLYGKTAEDAANELYDEEMMKMELVARGKAIVYVTHIYFIESDEDGAYAAQMEEAMAAEDGTFENIVSSLKAAGLKEPSVIIEYLDNNENIIYTKEYK